MIRKIYTVLLSVMFLFLLGACSNDTNEALSGDEQPTNTIKHQVCNPAMVKDISSTVTGTGHKILILMYHNLVTGVPTNEYDRKKSDFEKDLIYLKNRGFQFITMEDLLKLKAGQMTLNSDAIILTFDDGYASWYTKAFPLLKKHDLPATFFIVPEWIGGPNYMTWPQVWSIRSYTNAQSKSLFGIHSHTASHPFLKQWGVGKPQGAWQTFLDLQLGESKDWIVDITHQSSIFLALPYGDGAGDSTIIQTAKDKGYDGIRTSVRASFTVDEMDLYNLPSVAFLSTTDIKSIEAYF